MDQDPFKSAFPKPFLARLQDGVMRTQYRQVTMYKSPFDLVLYLQLIGRLRPRTVIEIGARFGGSALWFADTLTAHGIAPRIVSIDIKPAAEFSDPRILFLQGDALDLGKCLTDAVLKDLPHPWLVVEDSAHFFETTLATLHFFHPHLRKRDYIVVEDGVLADLPQEVYGQFQNGPNRAVAEFLSTHGEHYAVDRQLCNFYGRNITYNPNGWLRRVEPPSEVK